MVGGGGHALEEKAALGGQEQRRGMRWRSGVRGTKGQQVFTDAAPGWGRRISTPMKKYQEMYIRIVILVATITKNVAFKIE